MDYKDERIIGWFGSNRNSGYRDRYGRNQMKYIYQWLGCFVFDYQYIDYTTEMEETILEVENVLKKIREKSKTEWICVKFNKQTIYFGEHETKEEKKKRHGLGNDKRVC